MPTALLKFSQGATIGADGQALIVDAGSAVTVENSDNTDVASYLIELVASPADNPTQRVIPGTDTPIVLADANGATPSASLTPDAAIYGSYRIQLTVWPGADRAGVPDIDIRNVCVVTPNRRFVIPPTQRFPEPLPLEGPGAKPDELNFDGQTAGWAGRVFNGTSINYRLIDDALRELENLTLDHGSLVGLGDDDHTQYVLADGTRAFSGEVSGVTPTLSASLATKGYVDGLFQGVSWRNPVISRTVTTPPVGPNSGDRYIVAAGATGVWSGQDDDIAEWNGSTWDFVTPEEGWVVSVEDEERLYRYDGGWSSIGSFVDHGNLIGLGDDDHTQYLLVSGTRAMSGALNMGTNAITNAGAITAASFNGVALTTGGSVTDVLRVMALTVLPLRAPLRRAGPMCWPTIAPAGLTIRPSPTAVTWPLLAPRQRPETVASALPRTSFPSSSGTRLTTWTPPS